MPAPRTFWSTLWHQPPGPPSLLSRFTVGCGLAYAAIGATLYFLPAPALMSVLLLQHLTGYEEGLVRMIGGLAAFMGWFYVMGGRTRAPSFGLATVVDRLLAPLVLLPLWLMGMLPAMLAVPLALLDPLLGFVAYLLWRSESLAPPPA